MGRPPHRGAAEGGACVCDYFIFYIIDIYGYISYIFLIPVNPLTGVETNDDWVAWLTVVLI